MVYLDIPMTEPNRIDPEIRQQFKRIALSLFSWIVWMLVNLILGVVLDLGFFDKPDIPLWQHILFFIWFLGSFAAMVRLTYRIWGR